MLPMNDFIARFRDCLEALDAVADAAGDEALEDLNAELDDMLMAIEDIRPAGDGWREELAEALEDLDAVIDDYDRLASSLPGVAEPAARLRMAGAMLRGNM